MKNESIKKLINMNSSEKNIMKSEGFLILNTINIKPKENIV